MTSRAARRVFRQSCLGAVTAAALWLPASGVAASLPIPYVYVACIAGGGILSGGQTVTLTGWRAETPLATLEGKTVRIEGMLSPTGFLAEKAEIVADGCRPELQKAEALCNPCLTAPPQPPPMPPSGPRK